MSKQRGEEVNLFKALMNQMHGRTESEPATDLDAEAEAAIIKQAPIPRTAAQIRETLKKTKKKLGRPKKTPLPTNVKKRGRPATGKRSDPQWYGRTYYVRRSTDVIIENALFDLKRRGVDLDKSDLTDALLAAWASVYLDAQDDFPIGDILRYLPDRDQEDPKPEAPELEELEESEQDSTTT